MLKTAIKLNLGSRGRSMPGFIGMDMDRHAGVDIVGDVSRLSQFKNCEVSEIYSSHILEHFPHTKTIEVLKEWNRVLISGGILYIAVPDFRRAVEVYIKHGLSRWVENFTHGDQEYSTAFHYAIFDEAKLSGLLKQAGFFDVSRVVEFPVGDKNDCSRNKLTLDGLPVSLNMVAIK